MAANRRTVTPKAGGGWMVSGGSDHDTYAIQSTAIREARRELMTSGGGELVVKGRNGQVRMQNTIGRPDPRRSKG